MGTQLIYITVENAGEARKIATVLVKERLAACANIIESIRSVYIWNGEFHDEKETLLLAKTVENLVPEVIRRVREIHSYECPCIVSLEIEDGYPPFLDWVASGVDAD